MLPYNDELRTTAFQCGSSLQVPPSYLEGVEAPESTRFFLGSPLVDGIPSIHADAHR